MSKKVKVTLPIVVEGKYDKNTLLQIFDATVITLGGFAVFNSREKQTLIRTLARDGIIILTDSDGAGKQIRGFIKGIVPKEKIHNLYIPKIEGKEKRKTAPSKEGLLGVEGMERDELLRILSPFTTDAESKRGEMITKVDFYMDKLTGFENSTLLRDRLAEHFRLPSGMNANALLEALNILTDREGYREALEKLKIEN